MAFVPIEGVGAVGIVHDRPSYTLPPEAWSDGNNVKFANSNAYKAGGQEQVYGTLNAEPYFLLPWNYSSEYRWLYAAADEIHYTDGNSHTNVTRYTTTPGDDDYSAGSNPNWTGGVLSGVPILNHDNGTDYPQQWDAGNSRFADLSNWPVNVYCKAISLYKNFIIAYDITKSAVNYPYLVKWSDVADPGTVPGSWDETDATVLAGENPLSDTDGKVLNGLQLGDTNVVYKQDSIINMNFVGGVNVFGFRTATNVIGAVGKKAMASFMKRHIVVGEYDVVQYDGYQVQTIIDERNRKYLFGSMSDTYKARTVVQVNYANQEVWIGYVGVDSTTGALDKLAVWHWDNDTWSFSDLPSIAYFVSGKVVSDVTAFDSLSGTFDALSGSFNSLAASLEQGFLMGKVEGGNAILHRDAAYTDQGTNYTSFLERTGLCVVGVDRAGRPIVDQTKVKFVRAVFPKISAPNGFTLSISLGASDTPDGTVDWEGPYDFTVGTDLKVDFMVSGKYLAIRFEETSDQPWELAGYTLDMDIISEL